MNIFGLQLSASDLLLLSCAGALVLALLGFRYASEIRARDRFNEAAKAFSDTIRGELKEIYPIPTGWPKDIDHFLRCRFDTMSEAVGKFEKHLNGRSRKAFADAWFRFYCATGREIDRNCQCYHHYMAFNDNPEFKEKFKHNVDDLLAFAMHR